MIKLTLVAVTALVFFSTPALARHCPRDATDIDAALGRNTTLTAEQKAETEKLRDEGERLHKSGRHGASLDTLHKAMEILGIQH